jgi:predicted N-acetyltransferase YhbS
MLFIPRSKVAYVEPVATDPEYRCRGLGKAAVSESIRRVANFGAEVVWVGSGLEFYFAMGFEKKFTIYPWVKFLE